MKTSVPSEETSAFELKGSVLTVMVLYIKETDSDQLYLQLKKKIGPARSFFNNAPVLIDLKSVADEEQEHLDFLVLTTFLRGLGLVPMGIRACADTVIQRILDAGLALLPPARAEKKLDALDREPVQEPPAAEPIPAQAKALQPEQSAQVQQTPAMVITQPVRSGQQIVAQDCDLIILSSVNAGSEVIAGGNIHVYGALRGRAMAGVHGNADARIFSLQCNPELVAVGDAYVVNDSLEARVLNRCVMISRGKKGLQFEVMGDFTFPHR